MRDWDQEYLNEGFARLMQAHGADDLVKEWDMTGLTGAGIGRANGFFQFTYEVAQEMDSTGTAPAIVYALRGGGDIPPFPPSTTGNLEKSTNNDHSLDPTKAPLFSRIFYEKGATVNRMVATFLSTTAQKSTGDSAWPQWNAALGAHLNRFGFSNPTVEDLMRSLGPAFLKAGSKHTALTAMLPWLQRSGFPIVTLDVVAKVGTTGAWTLTVAQAPVSKYLPKRSASEPWWIPLRVSIGGGPTMTYEVDALTMSFDIPASAVGSLRANASAVPTIVGDPDVWGAFIVRYASRAQWNARLATYASGALLHEHARALASHVILLCATPGHERASTAALLIKSSTTLLSNSTCIGGALGSGDHYSNIIARAMPLFSLLGDTALESAMRDLVAPLAQRLGWSDSVNATAMRSTCTSRGATSTSTRTGAALPPWPVHEDPGVEARAIASLRAPALATAVLVNDRATVTSALSVFRSAVAASAPVVGAGARAAYIAAAREGSNIDVAALTNIAGLLLSKETSAALVTLINGFAAGAVVEPVCFAAIGAIRLATKNSSASKAHFFTLESDALNALAELLRWGADPPCRAQAWTEVLATATAAWTSHGAGATKAAVAALTLASASGEIAAATALVEAQTKSGILTADAAHAAVVKMRSNADVVAFNV